MHVISATCERQHRKKASSEGARYISVITCRSRQYVGARSEEGGGERERRRREALSKNSSISELSLDCSGTSIRQVKAPQTRAASGRVFKSKHISEDGQRLARSMSLVPSCDWCSLDAWCILDLLRRERRAVDAPPPPARGAREGAGQPGAAPLALAGPRRGRGLFPSRRGARPAKLREGPSNAGLPLVSTSRQAPAVSAGALSQRPSRARG